MVETEKQRRIADEVANQILRGETTIVVHGSDNLDLGEAVTSAALMGWDVHSRGKDGEGKAVVRMTLDEDSPMRYKH